MSRTAPKLFTVELANAMLPLVRAIVADVVETAVRLRDLHLSLEPLRQAGTLDQAHAEEVRPLVVEFESGQQRLQELETELNALGVELKDCFTGLVDFRSLQDDREVYLCWRLGEPEVAHWHELDAGFIGRRPIDQPVAQA